MKKLSLSLAMGFILLFTKNIYATVIFESEPSYAREESQYAPPDEESDRYSSRRYQEEAYGEPDYYPHYQKYHHVHHYSEHHRVHHTHVVSLPSTIPAPGEQVIIVNPRVHAWGAYTADGKLLKSGLATAGSSWCGDLGRPCRTKTGTFRINSLGSENCKSKKFPIGRGGAPMPYCMYFNGGQGIHGSYELAYANLSHGCVRVSVDDARWLRFNFTHINTKVVVEPY